jgi:hypothetical protein
MRPGRCDASRSLVYSTVSAFRLCKFFKIGGLDFNVGVALIAEPGGRRNQRESLAWRDPSCFGLSRLLPLRHQAGLLLLWLSLRQGLRYYCHRATEE